MLAKRLLIFVFLVFSGTMRGMDTPAPADGEVTFACDWCKEQKTALTLYGPADATLGVDCSHLLCDKCYVFIDMPRKPQGFLSLGMNGHHLSEQSKR